MTNIQLSQLSRTYIELLHINVYDLFERDGNYALKAVPILNALIFVLLVLSTVSNIFLLYVHFSCKENNFFKYFMPQYAVMQQVSLSIFLISNFFVGEQAIASSKFACFTFTYLAHICSTYANWIIASVPFIIKNLLNNSTWSFSFKLTMRVIYGMPLFLFVVYLVDIFYMDFTGDKHKMNKTSVSNVSQEELCSFSDLYALLFRDLIDLLFFFVFPLCFILYNLLELNSQEKLIYEMKLVVPFAFTLFCLPVVFIPIIRDAHLVLNDSVDYIQIKLFFTLAQILDHFFPIYLALIVTYFNMSNRKFTVKKYKNTETSHLESVNRTIHDDTPNDEYCLEEISL